MATNTLEFLAKSVTKSYLEMLQIFSNKLGNNPNMVKINLVENIKRFKLNTEKDDMFALKYFTKYYLAFAEEIRDRHEDYFRSQKSYIIRRRKNKKAKKKKNKKATYLCNNVLLARVLSTNKNLVDLLFDTLNNILLILSTEINDTKIINPYYLKFVKQNFEDNVLFQRMNFVMDDYSNMLSTYMDSSDNDEECDNEDSEDEDDQEESDNSNEAMPKMPFDENFLANSAIGKLAKDISQKIDPKDFEGLDNPADFMKSLFSNDGNNSMKNLLSTVVKEVEQGLSSGDLDEGKLASEAQKIMGSVGGGMPPGMPDLNEFSKMFGEQSGGKKKGKKKKSRKKKDNK